MIAKSLKGYRLTSSGKIHSCDDLEGRLLQIHTSYPLESEMTDIVNSIEQASHIVIGFFTPNYKPITEQFAANLRQFSIPHHLFAISGMDRAAAILMKPQIVHQARALYPGKSIVFMDVDCILRAPLDPLFATTNDCDVALPIMVRKDIPRNGRKGRDWVWASSRMMIWNATENAERLLRAWTEHCTSSDVLFNGDEGFLLRAISDVGDIKIHTVPRPYGGWEVTDIGPEVIVVHKTTRAPLRTSWLTQVRHRAIERIVGKSYRDWKYGIKR